MSSLTNSLSISLSRPLSLVGSTLTMLALSQSRRSLAKLDARALQDIGVTPAEAQTEARRAAWDIPVNWLK